MLEVSSLRSPSKEAAADHRGGFVGDHVGFPTSMVDDDDFMVDDNLLDYIDLSSCCDMPFFDADGDILPDLEESLLAEFSSPETSPRPPDEKQAQAVAEKADDGDKAAAAAAAGGGVLLAVARKKKEVTITEEVEDSAGAGSSSSSAAAGGHSSKKKASSAGKDSNGKRKVKVDWTPELHRRFVQAVEQLGIDKAVPSRILEIMGTEGLTRHNIASHLQKYRSHRKHLMAREAEAATWAQKRQLYAAAPVVARKLEAAGPPPWVVPTLGFPPPPPPAMTPPPPFCQPLHVWGHPPTCTAVESSPVWPRHLAPPRAWLDLGYWHQQQQQYNAGRTTKWAPQAAMTQGTPCVPPQPAAMVQQLPCRFPHPTMYSRPPVNLMVPPPPPPPPPPAPTMMTTTTKLAELQLQLDAHPSKESIDAAIGDVLVKPWLPLPLGLKPPSLDGVMSELHRHGIPNIPPAAT